MACSEKAESPAEHPQRIRQVSGGVVLGMPTPPPPQPKKRRRSRRSTPTEPCKSLKCLPMKKPAGGPAEHFRIPQSSAVVMRPQNVPPPSIPQACAPPENAARVPPTIPETRTHHQKRRWSIPKSAKDCSATATVPPSILDCTPREFCGEFCKYPSMCPTARWLSHRVAAQWGVIEASFCSRS